VAPIGLINLCLLLQELDPDARNYVKIVFEDSGDKSKDNVWQIFTVGVLERDVIVKNLRKLWKASFKVDLPTESTTDGTTSSQ